MLSIDFRSAVVQVRLNSLLQGKLFTRADFQSDLGARSTLAGCHLASGLISCLQTL